MKTHLEKLGNELTDLLGSELPTLKSNVVSPIDEIPKLAKLINAHATKLGLVYKPPIAETSVSACRSEVNEFLKTIMMLWSVINQVKTESEKYSTVFVGQLSGDLRSVIESSIVLVGELARLIDAEDDSSAQRLVGVGLVWETTEVLVETVKIGNSGVLKNKMKICNKVIVDALEELTEWLENPVDGGDENYDIDELLGVEKVPSTLNDEEEEKDDEEEGESEMASDEVIGCGKKWAKKIQLVKLLVGLLINSIPAFKYTVKFSKSLDAINENRMNLNEYIDDVIASIVYDSDSESAEEAGLLLDKEVKGLVELVKKINDEKKIKWVDSWVLKYKEN